LATPADAAPQSGAPSLAPTIPHLPLLLTPIPHPHTPPQLQVYPVVAAVGAGVVAAIYSTYLNFSTNPDVRVNKGRRTDAISEDPVIEKQGLAYKKNVYRGIGSLGKP
jgi:hypothetical protein